MEQKVKDLQAQNSQFQQMFLAMAKGQKDLFSSSQTPSKIKYNKPESKATTHLTWWA